MADSRFYILDDLPSEKDALDFTPYVETLVDVCESASTPLTIGVFGTWGSGKTSLMKMVEKCLPNTFAISWFNAWKYEKEQTIWRVLLLQLLMTLRNVIPDNKVEDIQQLEDLKTSLYKPVDRDKVGDIKIEWGKMGTGLAEGALQVGLAFLPGGTVINDLVKEFRSTSKSESAIEKIISAIHRESAKIHIDQIEFLEQFYERFAKLIDTFIVSKERRLVVFVDDLDRCLPEKAIEVLETIKLFVDVPGCIFILGLDPDVIARGVEIKYREFNKSQDGQINNPINGARYLEKIIQLPFQIPLIDPGGMEDFIRSLSTEWPNEECPKIFDAGLGDNPRQIKRTVNMFLMLWKLADKRKLNKFIKPLRLAKVVAIQSAYPELYGLLREEPRYLRDLEKYYRFDPAARNPSASSLVDSAKTSDKPDQSSEEIQSEVYEIPPALAPFTGRRAVRELLSLSLTETRDAYFEDLTPDEIRHYFSLTRRAETPQSAQMLEGVQFVFEPQMVNIPAGKFTMGTSPENEYQIIEAGEKAWRQWEQSGFNTREEWKKWLQFELPSHAVELSGYQISKYPITNREYQFFVKETGLVPPRGWDSEQYPLDKGDHPVVNVSWEEATAYCAWLSEKTNKSYRLPTEAEWEKASRGFIDDRIYPWGNQFDSHNANTAEAGINDTTPVGKFSPQGDSPFSCADMAGNVWEWCADWVDHSGYPHEGGVLKDPKGPADGKVRVSRGGSYFSYQWLTRCSFRSWDQPNLGDWDQGFRVASSV
jgi:formylglycine-generating enzyme required for sulfatase activity